MSQEKIDNLQKYNKHEGLVIYGFFNDFRFLSNFHLVEIPYEGRVYGSTEAAYMSGKTHNQEDKDKLAKMTPSQAKRFGRTIQLREDWEDVKDKIMYDVNLVKYLSGPSEETQKLKTMLHITNDFKLVEANWWGDEYWGECFGVGQNKLGKILMKVRDEVTKSIGI